MEQASKTRGWQVLLAFGIIYFVWGSTFLAIRVGVQEVPPLLFAGMRFLLAGVVLFGWMRARGTPSLSWREWRSATLLASLIFVLDYGLLFWAEQRVPSGLAAVMLATIPVFMTLADILILGNQRLTTRLVLALLVGIAGVAVLVSHTFDFGEAPIDRSGALALLLASVSWSVASALTRKLALPPSKAMSAGAQMLVGGVLLMVVAALFGEFRDFHLQSVSRGAWYALAYLTVGGSIVGFTAYLWLLHHESATKVATYAYVNPVVAVAIGYFLGGEAIGTRTLVGTALVLIGTVVIVTMPKKKAVTEWEGEAQEV